MPVRGEHIPKQETVENILALKGAEYLRLKKDEKKIKAEIARGNTSIKTLFKANLDITDKNGNHREIYAPLGDGINQIFIQLQNRQSISLVSNILDKVKDKLGAKASKYIQKIEVLQNGAVEAMLVNGEITEDDVLDWTTTKETESLIVKANKISK